MLLDLQRWPEAYDLAGRLLAVDPHDIQAMALCAAAALGLGRVGEAVERATAVTALAPAQAAGWLLLARARLAQGLHQSAYDAARTAVGLCPAEPAGYTALALSASRLGRWEEARAGLEALARLAPASVDLHRIRGAVLLQAGDADGARTALRAGLAAAPSDAGLLALLGAAEERSGRPVAARRAQRASLAADPRRALAATGLRGRWTWLGGTESPVRWWLTRAVAVGVVLVLVIGIGVVAVLVLASRIAVPPQGAVVGSSTAVGLVGAAASRALRRRRVRQLLGTATPQAVTATGLDASTAQWSVVPLRRRRPELRASMAGVFFGGFAGFFLAVATHRPLVWLTLPVVAPLLAVLLLATVTRPAVVLLRADGTPVGSLLRLSHAALGCATFLLDLAVLARDETACAPLVADRLLPVHAVLREPADVSLACRAHW